MILKLWKELRLQNQLLIIQIFFALVIFAILISACVYLVKFFSDFIQQQLLQQLALNSMVTAIQTAIIRVDMIGMVEYNSFMASRLSLKQLFEFQLSNNISSYSQVDDCLQSHYSKQFYSYQFCYGVYGQEYTQSDFTQIHNFTALQNQIIPLFKQKLTPYYFNIKFGKRVYFSQYQGQFQPQMNTQILNAIKQMEKLQSPKYFQQHQNQSGFIFMQISSLHNQMYIGAFLNYSENPYIKMINQEQYFNQRLISVFESGLMVADSANLGAFGKQFQDFTGFNDEQFYIIKNFANKGTVQNECDFQYKIQILCLINTNKKQQLVFSKYLLNSRYYVVIIVDSIYLNQIKKDFNQKLEQLIDEMFFKLSIQYMIVFIICIILQILFIRKLNRPLKDLQNAAKLQINSFQHTFQKIASVNSNQNQTQKLAEAFFNLVNLNKNNKRKQQQQFVLKKNLEFYQTRGTILRRESLKIIVKIWRLLQKKF